MPLNIESNFILLVKGKNILYKFETKFNGL